MREFGKQGRLIVVLAIVLGWNRSSRGDGKASSATPAASSAAAPVTSSTNDLAAETHRRWAERGFKNRFVAVNGVSLHLAEGGHGDPVFLLHGYPQSGEVWRYIAPELARTHRVIIPDLRGMGLSEAAKSGYDLENVAEDIHQIAHAMGLVKVDVVGHDWGAAVGAV
jgi:alpha/beta hydrolase fold